MYQRRLWRARVLERLELRAKQFRSRAETFPFRVPHEPLQLEALVDEALAGEDGRVDDEDLKARTVISLHWDEGPTWTAWAIVLPSGIHVYCDSDEHESRVLASVKRGSALEADRFFLELLAESSGHAFGIEMAGHAPDRVRTSIADREFLAEIFVELFEGTPAQGSIHATEDPGGRGSDFHADVVQWLTRVLVVPPQVGPRRRIRRLRDET
jgi:hypothetical protein